METQFDVVILGAGFAGLVCAARLAGKGGAKRDGIRIALASKSTRFVERLRIHEFLASEPSPPSRPLEIPAFLGDLGVVFIQGEILAIDIARRKVRIAGPNAQDLGYKRLVIALGSKIDAEAVPGVEAHAYRPELEGPRGLNALRARLGELGELERELAVIGSGTTGIELAGELAAVKDARVRLITNGTFADFATAPVRRALRRALVRLNVEIIEQTQVTAINAHQLETSSGGASYDLCVWCGGFKAHDVVIASGLEVNFQGRVVTDRWLRSLSDPFVYAVGDACIPDGPVGAPPRMSVFFALTTGAHVANVILADRRGKPARSHNFATYGQAIQVGKAAVGFGSYPGDRQIGPLYTGRIGYNLRAFFVSLLFGLVKWEKRFPGTPFWLPRPGVKTERRRFGKA